MQRKIYIKKIPSTDSRLKRHIEHDSESRKYAFNTAGITVVDTEHKRLISVLDQGQLGSCTGNAGIGAINTAPFTKNTKVFSPDEAGAVKLYSAAEQIDGGAGYPPEDQGSSGLSIAKVLKAKGLISGYQHTFTLEDALKALMQYPIMVGSNWYSGMDTPDADGRAHPVGTIRGGHEYYAFKVDAVNGRVWFCNSWNKKWGFTGLFYLTWQDFAYVLSQGGDVIVPLPLGVPAPVANPTLTITRTFYDKKETLGTATAVSGENQLTCKTLELADNGNKVNVSCIPKGEYDGLWIYSPTHKRYLYQLQKVPFRTDIEIHVGNYFTDLKGCIALGAGIADINKDGELDIISSAITIAAFETLMAEKPIRVIIQ